MNNLLNTELKVVSMDQYLDVITLIADTCVEPPLVIVAPLGTVILFDDVYKLTERGNVAELVDQESEETTIYIIEKYHRA